MYKIGQVLLILHLASGGGKSRLPRLHLFNWAMKRKERLSQLLEASKTGVLRVEAWGFDPALAIAIRFAIAEELLEETTTGYRLSDRGIDMAKSLVKDPDVFRTEKNFLSAVGKKITETMVETVAGGWEKS